MGKGVLEPFNNERGFPKMDKSALIWGQDIKNQSDVYLFDSSALKKFTWFL
jgi:hypothetical protein